MNAPPPPTPADLLTHAGFVRGIAHAALRGDGSVDDVIQETWLAALTNGPRSGPSTRSWLARVARNVSFGMIRKDRRRAEREQSRARAARVPSTADIAEREETRRHLLEALRKVTEPSRSALVLRYYEDLPPREVAKQLGVPVETARTRIKRGLVQLRAALDDRYEGDRKQWALALVPLSGSWARGTSSALGIKALVGAAGAATVLAVVIATGAAKHTEDDDDPEATTITVAIPGPTLRGTPQRPASLAPGRSVAFGRVTAGGQPVAARVQLRDGDRVVASGATASDGTYRFDGVEPGELWIEMPNEPRVRQPSGLSVDGQHARVEVDLPSTARSITGKLTYSDGRPFRGVVEMYGASEFPTFVTSTDAKGTYHFPRVPDTLIRVVAKIPDRMHVTHHRPRDAKDFDLVIDAELQTQRGRVLEDQKNIPVVGVRVHAFGWNTKGSVRVDTWTRTRPDGSYALLGFNGKPVQFSHRDYPQGVTRKGPDGTRYMTAAGRVHGVVRGPGRSVVANVRVVAITFESNFGRLRETLADDQGRYEMAVVPGQVAVYAYGSDAAYKEIVTWQRNVLVGESFSLARGQRVQHDLALSETGTLVGTVVDEQGRPIEGALVELMHKRDASLARGIMLRHVRTATDHAGAFRLMGCVAGIPYQVQASRFDYPSVLSDETFTISSGAQARTQIHLQRARTGVVTVHNKKTGEPVPGVTISLGRRKTKFTAEFGGSISGISREDGTVRFTGLSSRRLVWLASTVPGDYVDDGGWYPLPASDAGVDFEATVAIAPAMRIAGRVTAPPGVSLKDVRVDAQGIDRMGAPEGDGPIEPDGSFAVRGMPTGAYRLSVRVTHADTVYSAEITVRKDDEDVVLHLRDVLPAGAWRIRVKGPDGKPHEVHIARYAKNAYARTTWGSVAQLDPLPPDHPPVYVLVATSVGPRSPNPVPGAVLLGPFSPDGRELDVAVPLGRVLAGHARFADGTPIANGNLRIAPLVHASAGLLQTFARRAKTDADGKFTLRGLGAFAYQVTLETQPNGWTPPPMRIEADATVADLTLPNPPGTLRLTVRDPKGDLVGGAYIVIHDSAEIRKPLLQTKTRGDGVAFLLGLRPGASYHLRVGTHGKASTTFEDPQWTAAPSTISLVANLPFEGVVQDPEGTVLRRVRLYRRTALGTWSILNEHARPRFAVRLPPGRHFIQVVPNYGRAIEGRGTWVTAGDTNALLVFDPGPTLRAKIPNKLRSYASVQREGTPLKHEPPCYVDSDGVIEVLGLEKDATYVLWASPDRNDNNPEQGVCIYRTELRADGIQRALMEWSPAVPVAGTVRVPKGYRPKDVRMHVFVSGIRDWVPVRTDGSFRIRGLPAGSWKLVATLGPKDKPLRAEAQTKGAEPVEIVFE